MISLETLANKLNVTIDGNPKIELKGLASIETADHQQISFLVNPVYRKSAITSQAGALIVNQTDCDFLKKESVHARTYLISNNPYALFARVGQFFESAQATVQECGIHPLAHVHSSAVIPSTCFIGPFCSVEEGVILEDHVQLISHVRLGKHVQIGAHTKIYPMTVVYDQCQIGKRCILHGGVVIGSDGFGFAPEFSKEGGQWLKIPQTGKVIIGNDVEFGASCTIDRGALSDTIIGEGCKFDNQVQIGHNVKIGAHTVMAGCSGVAGSTEVGSMCIIGGYSNFSGHLKIADRTMVSGGTSITKSITDPGSHYTGVFPFTTHAQWEKNAAILRGLDKIRLQIKELIKKVL